MFDEEPKEVLKFEDKTWKYDLNVSVMGAKEKVKILSDLLTKRQMSLKDGKANLYIGSEVNINIKKSGKSIDISFDRPYIYVSSSYLSFLKAKVEKITITDDKIQFILDGFPDLSVKIE